MNKFKLALSNLFMGKLWTMCRSSIADAVVPGSGGIVFLGDSITHLGRWEMIFPQLPIRNFGISGERSDHLLQRLDPIVSLQPQKLFILIGTNDLALGAKPETIAANVDQIVARLHAALPGCKLHLQGVMPRQPKFAPLIKDLNRRYAQIAAQRGITFIDLFPAFDDGSGALRTELTADALHLQGSGYTVWAKMLEPHLR